MTDVTGFYHQLYKISYFSCKCSFSHKIREKTNKWRSKCSWIHGCGLATQGCRNGNCRIYRGRRRKCYRWEKWIYGWFLAISISQKHQISEIIQTWYTCYLYRAQSLYQILNQNSDKNPFLSAIQKIQNFLSEHRYLSFASGDQAANIAWRAHRKCGASPYFHCY